MKFKIQQHLAEIRKIHRFFARQRDRALNGRPVLQLDDQALVREFHQELDELHDCEPRLPDCSQMQDISNGTVRTKCLHF